MIWRKKTTEDIEELQHFVDGMKRGQTLATGDSLLETLRQIHDRREAPIQAHDHKNMLRERLRRQMAERAGQPIEYPAFVPRFAAPVVRHNALSWAVAASLAFHVGLGAFLLPKIEFDRLEAPAEQADEVVDVAWVPKTLVSPVVVRPETTPDGPVDPNRFPSIASASRGVEGYGRGVVALSGTPPSIASAPMAPPAVLDAQPMVTAFAPGLDDQGGADLGDPDISPEPPPVAMPEKVRPMSEVASVRFDRSVTDDYDTGPKLLFKPSPRYSQEALQYNIKGNVRLSVVFSRDGRIDDVKVVSGLGHGLDEAAIDAVKQFKFTPAMRSGQAVSVKMEIVISFNLR